MQQMQQLMQAQQLQLAQQQQQQLPDPTTTLLTQMQQMQQQLQAQQQQINQRGPAPQGAALTQAAPPGTGSLAARGALDGETYSWLYMPLFHTAHGGGRGNPPTLLPQETVCRTAEVRALVGLEIFDAAVRTLRESREARAALNRRTTWVSQNYIPADSQLLVIEHVIHTPEIARLMERGVAIALDRHPLTRRAAPDTAPQVPNIFAALASTAPPRRAAAPAAAPRRAAPIYDVDEDDEEDDFFDEDDEEDEEDEDGFPAEGRRDRTRSPPRTRARTEAGVTGVLVGGMVVPRANGRTVGQWASPDAYVELLRSETLHQARLAFRSDLQAFRAQNHFDLGGSGEIVAASLVAQFEEWLGVIHLIPQGTAVPDPLWALGRGIITQIAYQLAIARGGARGIEALATCIEAQAEQGRFFVLRALSKVKAARPRPAAPATPAAPVAPYGSGGGVLSRRFGRRVAASPFGRGGTSAGRGGGARGGRRRPW